MTRYPMWTRCQVSMEVGQTGQSFKTLEECPAGYPSGLAPNDLMDLCAACPKAEPQVLANVHITVPRKTPVPKKASFKCPVPKKK